MKLEEGFGVELLRIESICLLPHFPQLSNTALSVVKHGRKKAHM